MSEETRTETKRIGRYEVRATLGHGGFAVVYRAWDPTLTREVALKVLHQHLAEQPEFRARFLNEARAIAGLDHPNILPVYEVSNAGEIPFFTMRLVHGDTLAGLIAEEKPLSLARVAEIIRDLGSALDHLHAAGLVHRDLKPSNVMVEPSGRVSLMDFGIARISGLEMTGTSLIIGTPEYMAPEQCRGQPVGPAADIYALGALTYQLLAGQAPFECADTAGLLFAHAYSKPQPLRELAPGLPERVYGVVESALEKDPAARPGSAGAFADALLDAALSGSGPAAARPVTRVPPTQVAPRAGGDMDVEERLSAPASVAGGAAAGAGAARRRGRAPALLAIGAATALLLGVVAIGLLVTRGGGGEAERAGDTAAPVRETAAPPATSSGGAAAAVAPAPGETSVSTLAGSGEQGFADGPAGAARFDSPTGIVIDWTGNLYVAELGNRIRRITLAPGR